MSEQEQQRAQTLGNLIQRARLHAGSTFRFPESYLVLTFFYLTLTIALSLLLRWYERRIGKDRG